MNIEKITDPNLLNETVRVHFRNGAIKKYTVHCGVNGDYYFYYEENKKTKRIYLESFSNGEWLNQVLSGVIEPK